MKRYRVKMRGSKNTEKGVYVMATSSVNAQYKAETENPGWKAIDVQLA